MPKKAEGRKQKAQIGKWIEVASGKQGDERLGEPENERLEMENGEGLVAQSVPIWEELPPHPGSFVKSVKTRGLEHTELGRIYGGLEAVKAEGKKQKPAKPNLPLPLHCMEKSAETIDGKGVVNAPLRKRVRKHLKAKGIDEERTPRIRSGQERVRRCKKAKQLEKDTVFGRL